LGQADGFRFTLGLTQKFMGFSGSVDFEFESRNRVQNPKFSGGFGLNFQIGSIFAKSTYSASYREIEQDLTSYKYQMQTKI